MYIFGSRNIERGGRARGDGGVSSIAVKADNLPFMDGGGDGG